MAPGGVGLVPACNSDPDPKPEISCELFDYSRFDGNSPTVSFSEDVVPIFEANCAFCGCHANLQPPTKGLYLGPQSDRACVTCDGGAGAGGGADCVPDPEPPTDADTRKRIIEDFLFDDARTAPTMKRIEPGAPERSFLLHKVDGTAAIGCMTVVPGLEGVTCAATAPDTGCGDLMPKGSTEPIAAADRDVIRRWVIQGAQVD